MGEFVNSRWLTALSWVVAIAIVGLNGWLLFGVFRNWLA
jgi:manganese transport protein